MALLAYVFTFVELEEFGVFFFLKGNRELLWTADLIPACTQTLPRCCGDLLCNFVGLSCRCDIIKRWKSGCRILTINIKVEDDGNEGFEKEDSLGGICGKVLRFRRRPLVQFKKIWRLGGVSVYDSSATVRRLRRCAPRYCYLEIDQSRDLVAGIELEHIDHVITFITSTRDVKAVLPA
jgi:hypothetical protein